MYWSILFELVKDIPNLVTNPNLIFMIWLMVFLAFNQFERKRSPTELTAKRVAVIGAIGGGIAFLFYMTPFLLMALLDPGSFLLGIVGFMTMAMSCFPVGAALGIAIAFLHVAILRLYRSIKLQRKNKL